MKQDKLFTIVWSLIIMYFLLALGGCVIGLYLALRP